MTRLTIPDLPEDVHERLRMRAAENKRSIEAEAGALIRGALAEPEKAAAAPGSSAGMLKGQIEILGDWDDADAEIEAMFLDGAEDGQDPDKDPPDSRRR